MPDARQNDFAVVSLCHSQTPSTATVCLDEDELDDWWHGLDVECKADAFVGFSLRAQGQGESHIDYGVPPAAADEGIAAPDVASFADLDMEDHHGLHRDAAGDAHA